MGEQSVGASILAKFKQISNEKELERHASEATKPFGSCTSSDAEKINNAQKRSRDNKTEASDNQIYVGLSEKDVGITEYLNSECKGFSGIMKHRFSDFQVHEIDLDGNIMELTNLEVPEMPKESDPTTETEHRSVLSDEVWKEIDNIDLSESVSAYTEIDVSDKNKAERTLIHKAVKFFYGSKLFSNTITKDNKTYLKIGKCNNKERTYWPANQGIYLHFTVFKENTDTTQMITLMSQKLRINPNLMSYCGTKDKRGKTTQRMCIKRCRAEDLHNLKFQQFTFGDFCYKNSSLRLGDLSGNKFTIAVRNVESDDSDINNSLNVLKENGFINYYGLQRFGCSPLSPTFAVGKAILLKDWKKAIDLILKPRHNEKSSAALKKARETWWETKNAAWALKCLPKNDISIMGKVLRALKNQGADQYYNAFFTIPRNTIMLYVHSYQSLIWNKVVSKRIKEYGFKPLVGDLILVEGEEEVGEEKKDDEDHDEQESENDKEDNDEAAKENQTAKSVKKQNVRKLTKEDLDQIKFDELVLPLPGSDVIYPDNVTAKWYTEFLAEDGLSLESYKTADKVFGLFGSYRKIIAKVEDLSWKIVYYNAVGDDLILSDLDKLKNLTLPIQPKNSQYKGVILDFKLNASQYATMLLRELMKCETAVSYHATLTKTTHTIEKAIDEDKPNEKKLKTTTEE